MLSPPGADIIGPKVIKTGTRLPTLALPFRRISRHLAPIFLRRRSNRTLLFGSVSDAQIPALGASGAIAAVLGACLVFYINSNILTCGRIAARRQQWDKAYVHSSWWR